MVIIDLIPGNPITTVNPEGVQVLQEAAAKKSQASKADKLMLIRSTIASQLPILQKVVEDYASILLAKFNSCSTRTSSLAKFDQVNDSKPFIPKCLRLKIELIGTKGLVTSATFTDLQRELQVATANYQAIATEIMKKQASEELKLVHQDLVLTFCEKSLGLTKLYITCQQHDDQQPCSTLSFEKAHHLPIYILLCFFKKWIGEQYQDGASMFFEKYLHSTYEDVTKTCIQTGTPGESGETRENINALNENSFPLGVTTFVQKVVEMLDKVVPQTTFLFQGLLAQEEKKKVLASTLQIQINSSSTTAATAATAAALQQQAPLQQDDMSKLISNEVKKQLQQQKKKQQQKNSKGGQKNPPVPPQTKKGKKAAGKGKNPPVATPTPVANPRKRKAGVSFQEETTTPTAASSNKKKQKTAQQKSAQQKRNAAQKKKAHKKEGAHGGKNKGAKVGKGKENKTKKRNV